MVVFLYKNYGSSNDISKSMVSKRTMVGDIAASSPFSQSTSQKTGSPLLGEHLYLQFLLILTETAQTTKTRQSKTVLRRRFAALGTCHRSRDLEPYFTGATQPARCVLTPLTRLCNRCLTQIHRSIRMIGWK